MLQEVANTLGVVEPITSWVSANTSRGRKRAARALAEGRIPGKPGTKGKYTEAEFREVIRQRNAAYRAVHRDEIREKARLEYQARKYSEIIVPKKRGRPLKYLTGEEFQAAQREKAYRWRDRNYDQFLEMLRVSGKTRRAERAISEGRTPGLVGNPKRFATEEERRKARRATVAAHLERKGEEGRRIFWRVNRHNRRARLRGAGGSYTREDIMQLFDLQKGKCVFCLRELGKSFDVDHHYPLALGGTNDRSNLRLLCRSCNVRKSARDPADHALKNGLLCW